MGSLSLVQTTLFNVNRNHEEFRSILSQYVKASSDETHVLLTVYSSKTP